MQANGPSKDPLTRTVGPSVRILQLNIEGSSRPKCDYLARMASDNNIDVIVLQELHIDDISKLDHRASIPGFNLLAYVLSPIYGSAVYSKTTLNDVSVTSISNINNLELITFKVSNLTIVSVYKPPNNSFSNPPLDAHSHPCVYVGDFNSRHSSWGYTSNNANGISLADWAEQEGLQLVFDPKDKGSFHSARWQRDTNPDLCFVSTDQREYPVPASRRILGDFPRSQHRATCITIGLEVPLVKSVPKARWNFSKANWESYEMQVESTVRWIKPTAGNYDRFCRVLLSAANRHIPRGCRKEYTPGWNADVEEAYQEYLSTNNSDAAHDLLNALDESRRRKWVENVEGLDFTHSSKKSWTLLRKMGGAAAPTTGDNAVNPEEIAKRLQQLTKTGPMDRAVAKSIRKGNIEKAGKLTPHETLSKPFTISDLQTAQRSTKCGKAAGLDEIYPEFLAHLGKRAKRWLTSFYNNILETGILPPTLLRAKVIAILKPGKPANDPASYRPISLLSVTYKLLERLLYNRLYPIINPHIPAEQAGFRASRCCTDQVLALTSYVEAGFQEGLKTFAAFVDLKAAYDTVWVDGLLHKLMDMAPCKIVLNLIKSMLGPRLIKVMLGAKESRFKMVKNGLPQGSVLAPLLFNAYTSDLPATRAEKFVYADDLALAYQGKKFQEGEDMLTNDLHVLGAYYKKWRLCPNPSKTEVTAFHLTNCLASKELRVTFGGERVSHNFTPKYLGVTLDRALTFREHLEASAQKVKTRVNLVGRLAGTTWGARADVLRTSALALVYSTAEYCAPVWYRSAHTYKVDVQLNRVMRTITGTLRPTPTPWLPVLANIAPPHLRRTQAAAAEWGKAMSTQLPHRLPITRTLDRFIPERLPSRRPLWSDPLIRQPFSMKPSWSADWKSQECSAGGLVEDPSAQLPGFKANRKNWTTLNRIRTGVARCNYCLHKWGLRESPACDCGAPRQTVSHIVEECPHRRFAGGTSGLHECSEAAIDWLDNLDINL